MRLVTITAMTVIFFHCFKNSPWPFKHQEGKCFCGNLEQCGNTDSSRDFFKQLLGHWAIKIHTFLAWIVSLFQLCHHYSRISFISHTLVHLKSTLVEMGQIWPRNRMYTGAVAVTFVVTFFVFLVYLGHFGNSSNFRVKKNYIYNIYY